MTAQLLFSQLIPALLRGSVTTIGIAFSSSLIGFTIGTIIGFIETYAGKLATAFSSLYVGVIRGTPMLIQITFIFHVLPQMGIKLPAFWAAVVAIGINSGAYISQIIKSGIRSVSRGQLEAAQALGFSARQTMYYITLPQAVRVVIPALGNELVTLVKDSSLASLIGVVELFKEGNIIISRTYDAIPVYCAVALSYLVITTLVSMGVSFAERRTRINA